MVCRICHSYAINEHLYGRVRGRNSDLCDVHYWKEDYAALEAKYKQAVEAMKSTVKSVGFMNKKGSMGYRAADEVRDFLEANQ